MTRRVNNPEGRGLTAAENYIKSSATTSVHGSAGKEVSSNEVNHTFSLADQFMPEGQQVSLKGSLKLALGLLRKDLTKDGIDAIFARFDIKPPEPVIDPDDPSIIRTRYGVMETARPIIDRVNGGATSEEDIARLTILKALADSGAIEPRSVRGRAFAPSTGTRALGGTADAQTVSAQIGEAIARARGL